MNSFSAQGYMRKNLRHSKQNQLEDISIDQGDGETHRAKYRERKTLSKAKSALGSLKPGFLSRHGFLSSFKDVYKHLLTPERGLMAEKSTAATKIQLGERWLDQGYLQEFQREATYRRRIDSKTLASPNHGCQLTIARKLEVLHRQEAAQQTEE